MVGAHLASEQRSVSPRYGVERGDKGGQLKEEVNNARWDTPCKDRIVLQDETRMRDGLLHGGG